MMNFTFLKILTNTVKLRLNIFLLCFILLICANKSYSKTPLVAAPVLQEGPAKKSFYNSFFFSIVDFNSMVTTGTASLFGERVRDALNNQNAIFYTSTIILKQ